MVQKAAYGPKNPEKFEIINPIILQFGEGICGSVAKSGKAEIISDTSLDPRYRIDDKSRLSEITVPILFQNQVIGIIDSEHSEKNFFDHDDLEVLETIASMLAVKVVQAKVTEELKNEQLNLENKVRDKTAELTKSLNQLKKYNQEIEESNKQKEILLKEIHHRVKNNLQIVSSLMNLHSYKTESKEARDVFSDCQNKVKSMSLIHEQLYNKSDLGKIDARIYIMELGQELLETYNVANGIVIDYNLENLHFSLDISVPFGLILNELIVNAFKYAFPTNSGVIRIDLVQDKQTISLQVMDSGIGFDKANIRPDSLGLELIEALCDQLNADFFIESSEKGTKAQLTLTVRE